jgi:hypothetical protein
MISEKIEKTQFKPHLPVSPLFVEAEKLIEEERNMLAEIDKKVEAYRRKLIAEGGVEQLREKYREIRTRAETETKDMLRKFIREAYEGKYGKGELAFLSGWVGGHSRLVRILEILQEEQDSRITRHARKGPEVNPQYLLNEEQLDKQDLKTSLSSLFAEVSLEGTTEEEYNKLFREMISYPTTENPGKRVYSIDFTMNLFPISFRPEVQAGEVFKYGHASHHSGDIEGFAIVLPSGRLAVFSRYSGEYEDTMLSDITGNYKKAHLWGAIDDPRWKPEWSARGGTLFNASELKNFTEEEWAFLTGQGFKRRPRNLLINSLPDDCSPG